MLNKKAILIFSLVCFWQVNPMGGGKNEPIEYRKESEVKDPKTMPIFMATAILDDNGTTQDVEGLNINGDLIIKNIFLKKKKGPLIPASLKFDAIESIEIGGKEGTYFVATVNCKSGQTQKYLFSSELKFGGWTPGTDRFGVITLDIKELKKIIFKGVKMPKTNENDAEEKEVLEVLNSDKLES